LPIVMGGRKTLPEPKPKTSEIANNKQQREDKREEGRWPCGGY